MSSTDSAAPAAPANAASSGISLPTIDSLTQGISGAAASVKDSVNSAVGDFSSGSTMNAGQEFLESNGLLAKVVFVLLVLSVFMVALNLGMWLIRKLMTPTRSPYLVDGLINGAQESVVQQDPANKDSLVVYRSNNENGGMEFTWSLWIQIMAMPTTTTGYTKYKMIFVKGTANDSSSYDSKGIVTVNNGPGLYVTQDGDTASATPTTCALHFVMDVVSPNSTSGVGQTQPITLDTPNFPIGKWTHVAYRLQNKMLDCYVNGTVTAHKSFDDYIPKQNYDNVYLCGNGGFPGNLSNLRYYDHALSVAEINTIVYFGPNLKSANNANNSSTDFLSQSWYQKYA